MMGVKVIRGKLKKAPKRRPTKRKPVKARKSRECSHSVATKYCDICDEMKCWQCIQCEAKGVRSLGHSNDDSDAVGVEMAAADLYSLGYNGHCYECNCDQQAGPFIHGDDDLSYATDQPKVSTTGTVAAMADDVESAGMALPYPGTVVEYTASPATAEEYEAQRLAEPDLRDEDDCPDCAACTTTEGCAEHEQFTCEVCGELKPWTEGSADEQDGECDTCWHDRTSGSGAPGAENDQMEER